MDDILLQCCNRYDEIHKWPMPIYSNVRTLNFTRIFWLRQQEAGGGGEVDSRAALSSKIKGIIQCRTNFENAMCNALQ